VNLRDLPQDDLVRAEASADRLLALHERHEILPGELAAGLRTFLGGVHDVLEDRRRDGGEAGSPPPPHVPGPVRAAGQR
jgi:hypothetical protein